MPIKLLQPGTVCLSPNDMLHLFGLDLLTFPEICPLLSDINTHTHMAFVVYWALKANYLSVCLVHCGVLCARSIIKENSTLRRWFVNYYFVVMHYNVFRCLQACADGFF